MEEYYEIDTREVDPKKGPKMEEESNNLQTQ